MAVKHGGALFSREGVPFVRVGRRPLSQPAETGCLEFAKQPNGLPQTRKERSVLRSQHLENCIASTETFWILYVQVDKGLR